MTVLLVTTSYDASADHIVRLYRNHSIGYFRFDSDKYPISTFAQLRLNNENTNAELKNSSLCCSISDIQAVIFRQRPRPCSHTALENGENQFFIREAGQFIEGILALVPSHLWFNSYWHTFAAERKAYQLFKARNLGMTIPDTLITQSSTEAQLFIDSHAEAIVKPISFGLVPTRNRSAIYTNTIDPAVHDLSLVDDGPTLFQEKIDKECDVRVTWIDGWYTAFEIRTHKKLGHQVLDWRKHDTSADYIEVRLPKHIEGQICSLMGALNLRFGAIDFAVDRSGRHVFLEVNPAGQWGWLDQYCGGRIGEQIVRATR